MSETSKYKNSLDEMTEDMLREECVRQYEEKEKAYKNLLSQPERESWTCPVCDRIWGMFAYNCPHCGFRLGASRFIPFESIYVAEPGTPVAIGEGTDREYKTTIVSHCVIKNILHYIVWYPASPGNSYRIVSGGNITPLDIRT